MCKGIRCPHATQKKSHRDKSWVCELSGVQIAQHVEGANRLPPTGRNMGSGPTHMNSGPVRAGNLERTRLANRARAYEVAFTHDRGGRQRKLHACAWLVRRKQRSGRKGETRRVVRFEIDLEEVDAWKRQKAQTRANNSTTLG